MSQLARNIGTQNPPIGISGTFIIISMMRSESLIYSSQYN